MARSTVPGKEARAEVFEYIEAFYNRSRRHSTLGSRSTRCSSCKTGSLLRTRRNRRHKGYGLEGEKQGNHAFPTPPNLSAPDAPVAVGPAHLRLPALWCAHDHHRDLRARATHPCPTSTASRSMISGTGAQTVRPPLIGSAQIVDGFALRWSNVVSPPMHHRNIRPRSAPPIVRAMLPSSWLARSPRTARLRAVKPP